MLKIHQLFIVKFLFLFVGTLIVSSLISYAVLKSIVINYNKIHLQNSIAIMSLELSNVNNLDEYVSKVAKATNLRVTIINNDGVVIAESNADKKTMDNHGHRYEVQLANEKEFSHVVRYSKTLKVDFLYVAKKMVINGKKIYVRLSVSLSQIMDEFYSLWSKLIFLFLIILLSALYTSKKMSEKIVYDINQITEYLDEISNKNYKATIKTENFYEFLQISLLLKNLVKKLHNRDKQKRKHTAKLRLINRQRNDILSAISHEFKNPVAAIIGYAQTLQEDPDIKAELREKFLSRITSNGEKISKMLDRLALSVKLENSDLEIKESEFDLAVLCEEAASNLSSKYKNRDISVNVSSCIVTADKTMIELVLINLMDNALKYSEADIEVELKEDVLSVKDKGIGIKDEHLDKVTSKFYRVERNSWDNSMGIGLAMVKYILKEHGTSLDIKSVYSEGSTFSFNIKKMRKE